MGYYIVAIILIIFITIVVFGIKNKIERKSFGKELEARFQRKNLLGKKFDISGKNFQTIKLVAKKDFDSQCKAPKATIFYNKVDVGFVGGEQFNPLELKNILDQGNVSIYSDEDNDYVSEIKREIYESAFQRRIRYYLPNGTCFIDEISMQKTPVFES